MCVKCARFFFLVVISYIQAKSRMYQNIISPEKLPVVQSSPVHPAAHVHLPSEGRHVSGLQLMGHSWEQFLPKYPLLQAEKN